MDIEKNQYPANTGSNPLVCSWKPCQPSATELELGCQQLVGGCAVVLRKEKRKEKGIDEWFESTDQSWNKKGQWVEYQNKFIYPTDKQGSIRHFPGSVTIHSPESFFQFLHGVSMASIPWCQILTWLTRCFQITPKYCSST